MLLVFYFLLILGGIVFHLIFFVHLVFSMKTSEKRLLPLPLPLQNVSTHPLNDCTEDLIDRTNTVHQHPPAVPWIPA